MRARLRRTPKPNPPREEFDLTESEMESIMELVRKRATTQSQITFAVHPPKKLLDRPAIATSENVVKELDDSVFVVVFQDGISRMMSLAELVVFTYNLIVLKLQYEEVGRMFAAASPGGNREMTTSFQFSLQELMRPEMVRLLLSKIQFSKDPSDA